jgi:hypothetical protein
MRFPIELTFLTNSQIKDAFRNFRYLVTEIIIMKLFLFITSFLILLAGTAQQKIDLLVIMQQFIRLIKISPGWKLSQ